MGVEIPVCVKVRYAAPLAPATAVYLGEGRARIDLEAPTSAAPGQSLVAYSDGNVLFGGFIERP